MRRLVLILLLAGCRRPPEESPAARVNALIEALTVQNGSHPNHGPFHVIDAKSEAELWRTLEKMPTLAGGDDLLIRAVRQVYTKYHQNYCNGYLWHYPYLNSKKAIRLCTRVLFEYPNSPHRLEAMWLTAFALRVKPPKPEDEPSAAWGDQPEWKPDLKKARDMLVQLAALDQPSKFVAQAQRVLEGDVQEIDLPTWPRAEDPCER